MTENLLKFIYSEKATKFFEIFALLLTVFTVAKSKVKILQNSVAFSEYMNFKMIDVIKNLAFRKRISRKVKFNI